MRQGLFRLVAADAGGFPVWNGGEMDRLEVPCSASCRAQDTIRLRRENGIAGWIACRGSMASFG